MLGSRIDSCEFVPSSPEQTDDVALRTSGRRLPIRRLSDSPAAIPATLLLFLLFDVMIGNNETITNYR